MKAITTSDGVSPDVELSSIVILPVLSLMLSVLLPILDDKALCVWPEVELWCESVAFKV